MLITNMTLFFLSDHCVPMSSLQGARMSLYNYDGKWGMILVDLDESYQNIPKFTQIAQKKVVLLGCQKSCFFYF